MRHALLGDPRNAPEQLLRAVDDLTIESVTAAGREVVEQALVVCPEGTPPARGRLTPLDWFRPGSFDGRRFPSRSGGDDIVIGDDAIALVKAAGTLVVPFDACAAVICEPGDVLAVIGEDGTWMRFDPNDMRDGTAAVAAVRRAVAPGLFIPGDTLERARLVHAVAGDELSRGRWMVGDELRLLPDVLAEDEGIECLAICGRGVRAGLLVLTDRRLIFVYAGRRTDELIDLPWTSIAAVDERRDRVRGSRLTFTAGGETHEFGMPRKRCGELAAVARERVGRAHERQRSSRYF